MIKELRAAALTYQDVGATASSTTPPGFQRLQRRYRLKRTDLEDAAERLMTWQVHELAGLRVASSSPRAHANDVVDMRLGIGPLALKIPCRVVYTINEPDRVGFAYGTLPGHPEHGEELFVLQRNIEGAVDFTINAFSQPASKLARTSRPAARRFQSWMTTRYLHAADRR